MPRTARLDELGAIHHVMARCLDGQRILDTAADCDDMRHRLARVVEEHALAVYAWALMPNHVHLLVRTAGRPLERAMRSLLGGFAGSYNRRHDRRGHLFQNRFRSILVADETYFLQVVRYIHRNPLRSGMVADMAALDGDSRTGHAAILGRTWLPWQAVRPVLERFSLEVAEARRLYRQFVAAGDGPPMLEFATVPSGDLRPSPKRPRDCGGFEERILGPLAASPSVGEMEAGMEARIGLEAISVEQLVGGICEAIGVTREQVCEAGRNPAAVRARELIAHLWIDRLGRPAPPLALHLGRTPQALYAAARRVSRGDADPLELLEAIRAGAGRAAIFRI